MAVKIQVEFIWVVTSCRVLARYQRFRDPCYLHLPLGDRGNMDLWDDGMPPKFYMTSQPRRSRVNLGARWRWVVSFTPQPLYSR